MKNSIKKKIGVIVLVILSICIIAMLYIQENDIEFDFRKVNDISFSQLNSMEDIQKLNGKKVRILGYMSPASPYNSSCTYITDKPYSTEVFQEEKYNTMAVYSKDNKVIDYSNHPVYITGDLVVGEITDEQENSYKYRIQNAQIENAKLDQVEGLVKKYLILAQDNVLNDLNTLFGQVDMFIYFEEYKELEYMKEENLSSIDIERINTLIQVVNNYNDTTYNTIKNVLEELKSIAQDLNKLLEDKEYNKFIEQKEKFEDIYYEFYYYIGEFSV